MKIEVHHHHHFSSPALDRLEAVADRLEKVAKVFSHLEKIAMKNIDDLVAAVTAETSAEESLETLVGNLAQQVRDLKSNGTDPATAAKIDALATQIENNTHNIVNAVQQNTPAVDQGPAAAPVGSQQDTPPAA